MKLLALDIGSYSIKAVELDASFGKIELSDYIIERVVEPQKVEEVSENNEETATADTTDKEKEAAEKQNAHERKRITDAQLAAIQRVLLARPGKFDRLIVNFPKSWITTRLFDLPTKDRKTIQSSLNFELDDEIPFEIEDSIFDFAVLNSDGTNSTVLASVAMRKDVEHIIGALESIGVDPDMLTIEPWAIGQLLAKSTPEEYSGKPVCVVNFGSEKTSINMFVGNNPVMNHIASFGGKDITQAIALTYNLSFDEAEQAKIQGSFLITKEHKKSDIQITSEQEEYSEVISEALNPITRDIKQTLMAYKSQYKIAPKAVLITGGTSLIPNLSLFLEEHLQIPVFQFRYMSELVGQTLQLSETTEAQISTSTGLALSMAKVDRNYNINFRKDEFAKKRGLGKLNLDNYKKQIQYAVATLAFIFLNLGAQYGILSSRQVDQDERLKRSIKSVLGAVSPSVMEKYIASPSSLKRAIKRELGKYQTTTVKPKQTIVSAFDILNNISQKMPRSMTLDVRKFTVNDGRFELEGTVDSIKNTDNVEKAMKTIPTLLELKRELAKEDPKTKKIEFKFTARVAEANNVKTR